MIALLAAAVLGGMAWVGMGDRQSSVPRDRADLAVATALGRDKFALTAVIAQRRFMGLLEEKAPGQLSGTYRLPFAKPDAVARFELTQLWSIDGGDNYVPISAWEVPLDQPSPAKPDPSVLLDVAVNGNPTHAYAPRPVRLGYSLVISSKRTQTFEFVTFELKMPTR